MTEWMRLDGQTKLALHFISERINLLNYYNLILLKIVNASPAFGAPLDEQETKDFLISGKLNIHLGTVDENGDANVHPAWFSYDPSKEMIYVETSKQARKMQNLRVQIFTFVLTIRILPTKEYLEKRV
jgi:hypothetical protein